MVVFDAVILAGGFDGVHHGFKFPNNRHVTVNSQEVFFCIVFFFLLHGLIVLIDRDIGEPNKALRSHFIGVYI